MKLRKLLTNKYYNIGNGSFWKTLFPLKQPNSRLCFSATLKGGIWITREWFNTDNPTESVFGAVIFRLTLW